MHYAFFFKNDPCSYSFQSPNRVFLELKPEQQYPLFHLAQFYSYMLSLHCCHLLQMIGQGTLNDQATIWFLNVDIAIKITIL